MRNLKKCVEIINLAECKDGPSEGARYSLTPPFFFCSCHILFSGIKKSGVQKGRTISLFVFRYVVFEQMEGELAPPNPHARGLFVHFRTQFNGAYTLYGLREKEFTFFRSRSRCGGRDDNRAHAPESCFVFKYWGAICFFCSVMITFFL